MKLTLHFIAFQETPIENMSNTIVKETRNCDFNLLSIATLPKKRKKICVLTSPHGDRNAMECFELQKRKRICKIETGSSFNLDNFLKIELPFGLSCNFFNK